MTGRNRSITMARMRPAAIALGFALVLVAPSHLALGADGEVEVLDGPSAGTRAGPPVDYLAIGPRDWLPALRPLLEHRERASGLETAFLACEEGARTTTSVRGAIAACDPRFVLLAGDVEHVPAALVTGIGTDHPYACAGGDGFAPRRAVGRFPADTAEDLARMAARTLEYETLASPGEWQRDLAFFAGEGGFVFDPVLEAVGARVISSAIPAAYDVDMTYGSPGSPYFFPPELFADKLVARLNDGPLLVTFIGHGSVEGTQHVRFDGRHYPIVNADTARRAEGEARRTIFVVLACSTGDYDEALDWMPRAGDCIGEQLLEAEGGPVAFIGSSRPSAPYGNAALGYELQRALLGEGGGAGSPGAATLGEALASAKAGLLEGRGILAGLSRLPSFLGGDDLERELREHVLLYNLLGDPALRVAKPEVGGLDLRAEIAEGATVDGHPALRVTGRAGAGRPELVITLETERVAILRPIEKVVPGDPGARWKIFRNHGAANDKVLSWARLAAGADGAFEALLALPAAPEAMPPGTYVVKAAAFAPPPPALQGQADPAPAPLAVDAVPIRLGAEPAPD